MKAAPVTIVLKGGETVVLRSPSPVDAAKVLDHLKVAHAESFKNLNEPAARWEQVSVQEEENILARFESSPSQFMLVACYSDRVVGILGLVGSMPEFIKTNARLGMSVRQECCRMGLGTELMKHALALAKQMGLHRIEFSVRTYNAAGIALYEKCGFRRIGLMKDAALIDGQYVDEYAYELILV